MDGIGKSYTRTSTVGHFHFQAFSPSQVESQSLWFSERVRVRVRVCWCVGVLANGKDSGGQISHRSDTNQIQSQSMI